MATIPAGTKFIGIGASVPTPENKSSQNNGFQEVYTIEDVLSYDNATSGLTATDYQAAIDELVANPQTGYTETIVNISSAQILAMGTSPIELLPAPGAGKYYDIEKIIIEFTHVATGYTSPDYLMIKGSSGYLPFKSLDSYILEEYANTATIVTDLNNWNVKTQTVGMNNFDRVIGGYTTLNESVTLTTYDSTNPTLGDGTMRIIIYSKERTFGA